MRSTTDLLTATLFANFFAEVEGEKAQESEIAASRAVSF